MTQEKDLITEVENLQPEATQSLLNRRQFLSTGIAAAAAFALPKPAQAMEMAKNTKPINPALIGQDCSGSITIPPAGTTFSNPPAAVPSNQDVFIINTRLSGANVPLQTSVGGQFQEQAISVRTYDCKIPGPTFYLNPGDKLKITLKNLFPENAPGTCPLDLSKNYAPQCFYTTNLHFHGLHVSPKRTSLGVASDDVLIEVEPGQTQQYCVQLPDFHAPGSHWYHSHLHGSTGVQVSNGLAGAIIIKEPTANQIVPETRDKVWLVQEVIGADNPNKVYTGGSGRTPATYLVNGLFQPTITVNKKEWQRWRFINAGATPRSLMNLKLVKSLTQQSCTFPPTNPVSSTCTIDSANIVPMWLIAVDGISFYGKKAQSTKGWDLAPGNRADFLFWLPEETADNAIYYLIKDIFPNGGGATQRSVQVLATVKVTTSANNGSDPDPSNFTIPGSLPNYLKPIEYKEIFGGDGKQSPKVQDVRFSIPETPTSTTFGVYQVNEAQYGLPTTPPAAPNVPIEATLNTAEIWTLRNIPSSTGTSGSPHPFHIHVNPFQLVGDKIDPTGPNDSSNWRWWDTIAVDPNSCLPIVHRFVDFDGKYVLHCHILIHEDLGMMRDVVIKNDGTGNKPCETVKSTFTPSREPRYLTLKEVCDNLPTPEKVPNSSSNPSCKDSGAVCDPSLKTNQLQTQAQPQGPGSGGGGGGRGKKNG